MSRIAVICLARAGDLCNTLGFCKHLHDTGNSVDYVVDIRYRVTLLGASYVTPVPMQFGHDAIPKAIKSVEGKYDQVLLAQTWGKHWGGSRAHSYNVESWRNCGYGLEQFHDLANFPLVFDRRDQAREQFVCRQHIKDSTKPLLLLCVGCGKSSPFNSHYVFTQSVHKKWGRAFFILDLCKVKAGRLYDLLGLYERSSLLITGDTAALHLASAVPTLPVIALVNNERFLATTPRGQPLATIRYADVLKRVGEVHRAIARAYGLSREQRVLRGGT